MCLLKFPQDIMKPSAIIISAIWCMEWTHGIVLSDVWMCFFWLVKQNRCLWSPSYEISDKILWACPNYLHGMSVSLRSPKPSPCRWLIFASIIRNITSHLFAMKEKKKTLAIDSSTYLYSPWKNPEINSCSALKLIMICQI